jgi:hypothetical protein
MGPIGPRLAWSSGPSGPCRQAPSALTLVLLLRVYRFRTRCRCYDLQFGRMSWLRQDRGSWLFVCST